MRTPKFQYFGLDEYRERLEALRRRMEAAGADAILVTSPENLYYLSGYQTPGYYWYQTLIVPMDREPVLVVRRIEETNVEPLSWVEDCRPYEDYEDWIAHTRDVLADLGLAGRRIGLDYDSFFLRSRDEKRLGAALPEATFVDAAGLVEEGRLIKSPQEIEYMRQAARAAEAGLRAGIEACRVGVTENDVAAEIHRAQILAGSEYTGLPIFIRTGARDAQTHSTWARHVLEAGDSVTMEMPGCINRYHAAMYRQVFLGRPARGIAARHGDRHRGHAPDQGGDPARGARRRHPRLRAGGSARGGRRSGAAQQPQRLLDRHRVRARLGRRADPEHERGRTAPPSKPA